METIVVETWTVTRVTQSGSTTSSSNRGASRYVSPQEERAERDAIAAFGPFRVIDGQTAALVGVIDSRAPQDFAAMMAAHPQISVMDFVEAPGTQDDLANMKLGRQMRERGFTTRVGEGGSVRSGAVELFLAGRTREIAAGAEFAVHGWLDYYGRGAEDYPQDAPEHRRYLDYYADMGMAAEHARDFYSMTNSVPFEDALWIKGSDMWRWMGGEPKAVSSAGVSPELNPISQMEKSASNEVEAEPAVLVEDHQMAMLSNHIPRLDYLDLGLSLP